MADKNIKNRLDKLIESLELCETLKAVELIDELKTDLRLSISSGKPRIEVDADALEFLLVHIADAIKRPVYRH